MTASSLAVLDTNVLVALIDEKDHWHSAAVAVRDALVDSSTSVVYMDCVVNEAVSVIARRAAERKQATLFGPLLNRMLATVPPDQITWVAGETRRLFPEIVEICRESSGALNFHDALMALACRELGIRHLVSFDEDFDALPWLVRVNTPDAAARIGS